MKPMSAAIMAMYSAAALSMVSALFGAAIARIIWNDDSKHAAMLAETKDSIIAHQEKSIAHLHGSIDAMRRSLEIKDETIQALKLASSAHNWMQNPGYAHPNIVTPPAGHD